ncbi:DUF3352 domain-containing protein [Nonomuraea sp. FMUSA5-5]|uniref:DUF3352 domain-containing protein n=1 Tax=Nonomuraea composti TaxID=2720023 RepID=A0ABX1BBB4_9ACTN|nr:DUF3352 domain-containing protein [Nonomuraea sp. FMUSA5-5]NJP92173.1 DUF3352 domain-containing protein [Nonomuraea sp. FMUSA5-5]
MSANNPPYGQDPDRTTAYNWNQGQQPEQQPTAQYPGPPYPPQQPYQQQQYGQPQYDAQGQGAYGQQASYGQQPPYGPQQGQPQYGPQQPSYGGAPQYGGQQPQQGWQQEQGGWQQQQQPQQGWQQEQAGWQQQQAHQQQGGWQQEQGWQQQAQYEQGGWQHQGPEGFGQPEPAKKGRKGWVIAIAAALAVVLLGGGAVWAVGTFGGGGTQPNDVLPANSIAYARLDLDPAANQKLALFQLARKFTVTKDSFSGEDPRKALFDLINEQDADSKLDFAKDVDPWLGSRVGFAAVPSGKEEPDFAVAVQVKDQEAAKAGIAKLMDGDKYGLAFREDYALLSSTQALADKYAKTEGSLSDNAEFSEDMGAVGEQGVLSFWADMGGLMELAKKTIPADQQAAVDQVKDARFAGALRFDSAYVELAGVVRGAKGMTPQGDLPKANLGTLPASTAGALSISGLDQVVTKQWAEIEKQATAAGSTQISQMLQQAKTQFGLELPGDLATVFGKNLTIAVDGEGLDSDQIKGGVRVMTDPAKAQAVIDKVQAALTQQGATAPQIAKVSGDGVFTVATTDEYAKKLAAEGTLGDSETFQTAIPNAADVNYALFVDLDKVEKLYLASMDGDDKANLQVLRAVGLSGTQTDTEATFSLRLLFN